MNKIVFAFQSTTKRFMLFIISVTFDAKNLRKTCEKLARNCSLNNQSFCEKKRCLTFQKQIQVHFNFPRNNEAAMASLHSFAFSALQTSGIEKAKQWMFIIVKIPQSVLFFCWFESPQVNVHSWCSESSPKETKRTAMAISLNHWRTVLRYSAESLSPYES